MSETRAGYLVGLGMGLGLLSAEIADEHQVLRAAVLAITAIVISICGAMRLEFSAFIPSRQVGAKPREGA